MSWSKIKKAINSSIGTSNFVPLDQLIINSFNSIKNSVKNGSLIAGKADKIDDNWETLNLIQQSNGSYTFTSLNRGVYVISIVSNSKQYVSTISVGGATTNYQVVGTTADKKMVVLEYTSSRIKLEVGSTQAIIDEAKVKLII